MNKPITVVYEEFKQELVKLINNSGLPAFVIESILHTYLNETKLAAKKQYELDKAQYEKTLADQVNSNTKNNKESIKVHNYKRR